MNHAAIFSRKLRHLPYLSEFFPNTHISAPQKSCDCVFGWGYRPTANRARQYAQQHALPYVALEDGFVRSLGLGVDNYPTFSLIYDDVGMYYHTSQPNRLEKLILQSHDLSDEILSQAQLALQTMLAAQISKYNHAPPFSGSLKRDNRPLILLIDQTFGDMAVQYGGADEQTFAQMLAQAVRDNPDADIVIKTHPDVLSGKKRGYFAQSNGANVRIWAQDCNPISLLKQVDKVYCVTSQMGFEALMCGKEVHVFGAAWYAGWGLTQDYHQQIKQLQHENRRAPRSLLQLFAAAYCQYTRYINPHTGKLGNLLDLLHYLQKAMDDNERLRGTIYCVGVSLWKQAVMKPFFRLPACDLRFVSRLDKIPTEKLPENSRLLVWGRGKTAQLDFAQRHALPILHMEDGFIRSVGLGSNLTPPLSLVIDDVGIYFDATAPSRLEWILQNHVFSQPELTLATEIQQKLLAANISKYNVGNTAFRQPETTQPILLVTGQVEDDASIQFGSPQIRDNLALLKLVRERNPHAHIIYKPHPDVVSGNRVGQIPNNIAQQYANQIETETDILSCLNAADEVHTLTSLTGFEALLRGKKVFCYGLPFYAGWGLTHDEIATPRRTRQLTLPELVCGTLVHYPQYIHPHSHQRIDVLGAIEILREQKRHAQQHIHRSWHSKQHEKIKQLWRSLRG